MKTIRTNSEEINVKLFYSFKDILSDNDINTIDTNAKTKTEDTKSMTRPSQLSCCPLDHRVGRNVGATWLMLVAGTATPA